MLTRACRTTLLAVLFPAVVFVRAPSIAAAPSSPEGPRLELATGEVIALDRLPLPPEVEGEANEVLPFVVALAGEPTALLRQNLEAAGATVVGAIPPSSYLVRAPGALAVRLRAEPWVAAVAAVEPRWKLAPALGEAARETGAGERLRVEIVLHRDVPGDRLEELVRRHGERLASLDALGGRVVTAAVPAAALEEIAALPDVAFVQPASEGRLFNDAIRVVMQTDRAHPNANQAFYNPVYGLGVYGAGELVAIADTGLRSTHEQLATASGKLQAYVNGAPGCATMGDPHSHGTAVASTLAGDAPGAGGLAGTANGFDGLAFGTSLFVQDIFDDSGVEPVLCDASFVTTGLLKEAFAAGARVHNNSWGHMNPAQVPYGGSYGWRSRDLDLYLKDPAHRESVVVFAVGNEGGRWLQDCSTGTCYWYVDAIPRTVSEEAHAKNVISVGGSRNGASRRVMYLFSSRGPANDCIPPASGTCSTLGRIKPDLVAPASTTISAAEASGDTVYCPHPAICPDGYYGTSHAAPAVSAAAALVRDYFAQGKYPNDAGDPPLGGPVTAPRISGLAASYRTYLLSCTVAATVGKDGGFWRRPRAFWSGSAKFASCTPVGTVLIGVTEIPFAMSALRARTMSSTTKVVVSPPLPVFFASTFNPMATAGPNSGR